MTPQSIFDPGDTFAEYTIEQLIGRGGMGEVYRARHPRLPRTVALKVLSLQHSDDHEFRRRFEREADLVTALEHPAIVRVYDRGEEDRRLWISMQFVDGSDALRHVRDNGPFTPTAAVQIIQAVANAIDYAHNSDVIHRDVKPANILISDSGTVKNVYITDFGIAHHTGDATKITSTDSLVGSVDYTAPERLLDEPVVAASDQYSLGCTAFQLLTGRLPFASDKLADVVTRHLSHPVPSARMYNREVPPLMDIVLARAMSKNSADRYPDCMSFAADMGAALRPPRRPSAIPRPRSATTCPAPHNPARVHSAATIADQHVSLRQVDPTTARPVNATDTLQWLRTPTLIAVAGVINAVLLILLTLTIVVT